MDRACRIPTEAEEDWITPVSTAPATTPRMGLENMVRMLVNSGTLASGFTAADMMSMPYMSTAKPIMIEPVSRCFSFLLPMNMKMPMSASTGVKDMGLSSCTRKLPLSMPVSDKIHEVTEVPTFAPMMM